MDLYFLLDFAALVFAAGSAALLVYGAWLCLDSMEDQPRDLQAKPRDPRRRSVRYDERWLGI